ncbi:MAG: rRNA maturation RNase YbeY [bacterium]
MKVLFDKDNFMISSTLKTTPKNDWVLFDKIKDKVMGSNYELSLNFIGKERMRTLNRTHREKDYTTDVLSFPLDDLGIKSEMGEVFINLDVANKKSKDFDRTPKNYLLFLFVHSLMHLKGFDHGDKMESEEEKVRKFFTI